MTKTVNIRSSAYDVYILETAPEFKRRGRKLEEEYASD
jgi:hypothetical protein